MVLLKDLQDIIHHQLIIVYKGEEFKEVWCYSKIFEELKDKEVIGIRCDKDCYLVISVK